MDIEFVVANGLRFAYLTAGTGPLVVLAHGFPDSPHTWDRAIVALAEAGYRAAAPFMRGYYPTAIPDDRVYDSDTLGRDVIGIIDALGETSATVVGHDWGASAAYSAAALHPDRVRQLVTFAIPHPQTLKPTPSLLWKIRHFGSLRRAGAGAMLRANDSRSSTSIGGAGHRRGRTFRRARWRPRKQRCARRVTRKPRARTTRPSACACRRDIA
jgi:pimeloyl-ACP methyl ester carboxylesterase